MGTKYILKVLKNCFGEDEEEEQKTIECCICLDDYCYSDITRLKPCFHSLCHDCFDEYLKYGFSSCPICMEKITNGSRFRNIPILSNISRNFKRISCFLTHIGLKKQHLLHLNIAGNISKYINRNNRIECYDTRIIRRNKFIYAKNLEEHIKQNIHHRISNIEKYSNL